MLVERKSGETSSVIAVDTNILVYSVDVSEPAKMAVADSVLKNLGAKGTGVLLWQVACEFLFLLGQLAVGCL